MGGGQTACLMTGYQSASSPDYGTDAIGAVTRRCTRTKFKVYYAPTDRSIQQLSPTVQFIDHPIDERLGWPVSRTPGSNPGYRIACPTHTCVAISDQQSMRRNWLLGV